MENRNPNKKLWKHILKLWPEAMEYEDPGVTTEVHNCQDQLETKESVYHKIYSNSSNQSRSVRRRVLSGPYLSR